MNPFFGSLAAGFSVLLRPVIHHLDKPSLPKYSGNLALSGLRSPVRVVFQNYGVPHVSAANEYDLFFAQGFLHAQERLWQMESNRLFLSGRLAEVLGDRNLGSGDSGRHMRYQNAPQFDQFMRLIGVRHAAVVSAGSLDERQHEHLTAYAQGVNRYIEQCGKKLPWEFRLLRYSPQPWQPLDSITIAKGLALLLCTAIYTRLNMLSLVARLGHEPEKLRSLWPDYPDNRATITKSVSNSAENLWRFVNGTWAESSWHAAGHGSNNWVLSATRSTSASALLCNDPHLRLTLPSMFYLMQLRAEPSGDQKNFDVRGASIPGLPYVQLGHNRHIGWGVTAALCDDADLYREKIHRLDNDLYLSGDQWLRMSRREEVISVRRKESIKVAIRSTHHGPVISDFPGSVPPEETLALRWTAHDASNEFRAVYGVNRARGWDEFLAALADHHAPTLNYVYADRENNIGYTLAGKIPERGAGSSLLPIDGSLPANEWRGFIPFEALPRLFNPPEGACASANNRIVEGSYPRVLPQLHEPPHRIRRISELLGADERLSAQDMTAIQMDTVSLHARELVQTLESDLRGAALVAPEHSALIERLWIWDGDCRGESTEAALFHVFHHRLMANLLVPTLGEDTFRSYVEILNQCIEPLDRILADPRSSWFAARSRAEIVAASIAEACAELRTRCGPQTERWSWGRIHRLQLAHALGRNPLLRNSLNVAAVPSAGDGMTINAGFYQHSNPYDHVIGPALRMIIDTGAWERSGFVLPGGQSGHPASPHYRNQFDRWLNGKLIRFAVDQNTAPDHCLILSPC